MRDIWNLDLIVIVVILKTVHNLQYSTNFWQQKLATPFEFSTSKFVRNVFSSFFYNLINLKNQEDSISSFFCIGKNICKDFKQLRHLAAWCNLPQIIAEKLILLAAIYLIHILKTWTNGFCFVKNWNIRVKFLNCSIILFSVKLPITCNL